MSPRTEWQGILDAETKRWSSMSCDHLIAALRDVRAYEIEVDSKQYQVEVQLLENTNAYVHVQVVVDDGSLPGSIVPLPKSFICQKSAASAGR